MFLTRVRSAGLSDVPLGMVSVNNKMAVKFLEIEEFFGNRVSSIEEPM